MTKIVIKGCIYQHQYDWMTTPSYSFNSPNSFESSPEYVKIADHTIDINLDLSKINIVAEMVAKLRKQKEKVLQEATFKVSGIEDKIQQLLCITNEPSGTFVVDTEEEIKI